MNMEWSRKKAELQTRLRRVEGQLRGVQGMIEAEAECELVAQQLSAARKALDKAFYQVMACAMERELAPTSGKAVDRIAHFTELLARYG